MDTNDTAPDGDDAIRETYVEYGLGSERVATIADPTNDRAWIQSNVVLLVVP